MRVEDVKALQLVALLSHNIDLRQWVEKYAQTSQKVWSGTVTCVITWPSTTLPISAALNLVGACLSKEVPICTEEGKADVASLWASPRLRSL